MGTRCLTFFADHAYPNDPIACIYRQMDGYPSVHGKELAEFLKNIEIVNGFVLNMAAGSHANGIECLAAQTVAYLKDEYGIGMIYLQTPNRTPTLVDYAYKIFASVEKQITIEVYRVGSKNKLIFKGDPSQMLEWIENLEDE